MLALHLVNTSAATTTATTSTTTVAANVTITLPLSTAATRHAKKIHL